jgi:hypothetical protein
MAVWELKRMRMGRNLWRSGVTKNEIRQSCGETLVLFRILIGGLVGFGCGAGDGGVTEWMISERRRGRRRRMLMTRTLIESMRKKVEIEIESVVEGAEQQENGCGLFLG